MKKEIPMRPYYVCRPFKFLGLVFNTDDVFPPEEMRCNMHRLVTLANNRHLTVARVVSDEDLAVARRRVRVHFRKILQEEENPARNEDIPKKAGMEEPLRKGAARKKSTDTEER